MLNICSIGELLIDFSQIINSEDFPSYKALPGGAPCNFLAACTANSCKCSFIGKVGDDDFGVFLKNTLIKKNINVSGLVMDKDIFTTLAFVSLDKTGERSFSFSRKPGADTMLKLDEIKFSLIDECNIFHFGTLSLTNEPSYSSTISALKYCRMQNKIITFDPNYREALWNNKTDAINSAKIGFSYADIVKISEEEADFYFGLNCSSAADILLNNFNVKLVAVTLGSKGCFCKTSLFEIYVEGIQNVNTIDTTGAGDIWFGYFISNIISDSGICLNEDKVYNAAKLANAAASLSTSYLGGITSVPTINDTINFMGSI